MWANPLKPDAHDPIESMWDKDGLALTLVDLQGRGSFRNFTPKDGSVNMHIASAAVYFNNLNQTSLQDFIDNILVDDNKVFDLIKYKLECGVKHDPNDVHINN